MNGMDKSIWQLDTNEVRDVYVARIPHSMDEDTAEAEFDTWLARIKADAWDEAVNEARARLMMMGMDEDELKAANPYR